MATIDPTPTWNESYFLPSQPKKRLDRWKVCKDFLNGTCLKTEDDCEYAHPSSEKEIREGIVTVCMDHVNDQCSRASCKYLHPPTHICTQIHDHKKRPYTVFKSKSLSSNEREQIGFFSSPNDYSPHYQFSSYPFYYPNGPHSAVYFPPYSSNPLSYPGPGFGTSLPYQSQLSTAPQESGEEQSPQKKSPSDLHQFLMCDPFIPQYYPIITY